MFCKTKISKKEKHIIFTSLVYFFSNDKKRLSSNKTIRSEIEVSRLYNYPYRLYITKSNL
uniref:Uncharacterized protein n=1 Tax=Lepeophtheirus salmonis TaxID=72036 RepID=A0A0K2TZ53_LEPSM